MGSLIIVKPERPVAVAGAAKFYRTLTPDPKEAVAIIGTGDGCTLDYGAPVTMDTAFLGYHDGLAGQQWAAGTSNADGSAGIIDVLVSTRGVRVPGYGPPYHAFCRGAPLTSRYWQVQMNGGAGNVGFGLGVIALGLAFVANLGPEWGAGRAIEDTGTAERLFGGGFGIDDGTAAGGYQWTFGDLNDDERRRLYQLVKDRRTTRSVLVVEDDAQTDGLNERIHWGLFRKLDAYERLDPLNTKWSLQIGDWA